MSYSWAMAPRPTWHKNFFLIAGDGGTSLQYIFLRNHIGTKINLQTKLKE